MKTTVQAHVFMVYEYDGTYTKKEWRPEVWRCKLEDSDSFIWVGEQTVEVDVPDNFDPVPKQVTALEKEKAALVAEYTQKLAEISERLSKLLAIGNEVPA
jgi:hypothetical protein